MNAEANESYRKIALLLAGSAADRPGSFVFASADGGEGTTTTVLNVARHLKHGCALNPLVIEFNLVRPVLARMFALELRRSVQAIAQGRLPANECVQSGGLGIAMIPAAPHEPRSELSPELSATLRRILTEVGSGFDVVLVDAPPVLKDAGALAAVVVVPRLLLVVAAGQTRTEMLDRAKRELERVEAQIVGTVLNRHRRYIPGWIYRAFIQ